MDSGANKDLHVLCYGAGVNSVALLLECTERAIVFDAILFADVGKERKETYRHMELMREWCKRNGQPDIGIVRFRDGQGKVVGLYDDCLHYKSLPSIAYGHKNCSLKFKKAPQDIWMNNWPPAVKAWKQGYKVYKYMGFDADEEHRTGRDYGDKKYVFVYKLVEWGWGREECVNRIKASDVPLPPKSSCTFCPSMKVREIIRLYEEDPREFYDAVKMERVARPNLSALKGLGRDWSWWDLIVAYRYLRLLKRNPNPSGTIPKGMQSMMKRVHRAMKAELIAYKSYEDLACSMFPHNREVPCDCYDG